MALVIRYSVPEVAVETGKHPVTIRLALEGGQLHGTQSMKGGRWSVREDCLEAYLDGEKCAHQVAASQKNVTPLRAKRPA